MGIWPWWEFQGSICSLKDSPFLSPGFTDTESDGLLFISQEMFGLYCCIRVDIAKKKGGGAKYVQMQMQL